MALWTTYRLSCVGVSPEDINKLLADKDAAQRCYEDTVLTAYNRTLRLAKTYQLPDYQTDAALRSREAEAVRAIDEGRVGFVASECARLSSQVHSVAQATVQHLSLHRQDQLAASLAVLQQQAATQKAHIDAIVTAKIALQEFMMSQQAAISSARVLPFAVPHSPVWNAVLSIPSMRRGLDTCRPEHKAEQLEGLQAEEEMAQHAADYTHKELDAQAACYAKARELLGDDAVREMLAEVDITQSVAEQQVALMRWLVSDETPANRLRLSRESLVTRGNISRYEAAIDQLVAGRFTDGVRLSDLEIAETDIRALDEQADNISSAQGRMSSYYDRARRAQTYVEIADQLRLIEAHAFAVDATVADKQAWMREWLEPNKADAWIGNEAIIDVIMQVYRAGMPQPIATDHHWLKQCFNAMSDVHQVCWRPTSDYDDNWQVGKFLPQLVQLGKRRGMDSDVLTSLSVACVDFPGDDALSDVLSTQAQTLLAQVAGRRVLDSVFTVMWAEGRQPELTTVTRQLYRLAHLASGESAEAMQTLHDALTPVLPSEALDFNRHCHALYKQRTELVAQLQNSILPSAQQAQYLQHFDAGVERYFAEPTEAGFVIAQAACQQWQDFARRETAVLMATQAMTIAELDLVTEGLAGAGRYSALADAANRHYQTAMTPASLTAAEATTAALQAGIAQELALDKRIARIERFASALPVGRVSRVTLQGIAIEARALMYDPRGVVTDATASAVDDLLSAVEVRLRDDIHARRLQDRLAIANVVKVLRNMFFEPFADVITDQVVLGQFQREFAALAAQAGNLADRASIGDIYGGVVTVLLRMIAHLSQEADEAGSMTPELRRAMAEVVTTTAFDLLDNQPITAINRYAAITDAHAILKERFMGVDGEAGGALCYLGRGHEAGQTETTVPYYTGRFDTPRCARAASEEDALPDSEPTYQHKPCSATFYRLDWDLTTRAANAQQAAMAERDTLPDEKQAKVATVMSKADQTTAGNVASCGFWCAVARFCLLAVTFGQYDIAHSAGREQVVQQQATCATAFSRVEAQLANSTLEKLLLHNPL